MIIWCLLTVYDLVAFSVCFIFAIVFIHESKILLYCATKLKKVVENYIFTEQIIEGAT